MNDECPSCGHVLCVEHGCPCNCDAARAERDLATTRETLRAVEAERDRLRTALERQLETWRAMSVSDIAYVSASTVAEVLERILAALAAREAGGGT